MFHFTNAYQLSARFLAFSLLPHIDICLAVVVRQRFTINLHKVLGSLESVDPLLRGCVHMACHFSCNSNHYAATR